MKSEGKRKKRRNTSPVRRIPTLAGALPANQSGVTVTRSSVRKDPNRKAVAGTARGLNTKTLSADR